MKIMTVIDPELAAKKSSGNSVLAKGRTTPVKSGPDKAIRSITNEDGKIMVTALAVIVLLMWKEEDVDTTQMNVIHQMLDAPVPLFRALDLPVPAYQQVVTEVLREHRIVDKIESARTFAKGLLVIQKEIEQNHTLSPVLLTMLNDTRLAINGSARGFEGVEKNLGLLRNKQLLSILHHEIEVDTQREHLPELQSLTKKLGGKGLELTLDQRERARQSKPAKYQEYLNLHRLLRGKALEFVRKWVRANAESDGLADYSALRQAMTAANIQVHGLPDGFHGKIDDQGQLYTVAGHLINGVPRSGAVIKMNPKYDPHKDDQYVFRAHIPGAVTQPTYYTHNYKSRSTEKKYVDTAALGDSLKTLKKGWRKILKKWDGQPTNDPRTLAAMVLEIVYHTQGRIGSESGETDKGDGYEKTFGISVLRCKHIRKVQDGISFNYLGKSGMKQNHRIYHDDSQIAHKLITGLLQVKQQRKPNDPLFMTKRGSSLGASKVNELLRELGAPSGVTIKKFRTLRGTKMMNEIAANNPFKDKPTATPTTTVTNWIRDQAVQIGKQLGHRSGEKITGQTAIVNYCEPHAMLRVYKDARAVPPPTMLKLVGVNPRDLKGYEG